MGGVTSVVVADLLAAGDYEGARATCRRLLADPAAVEDADLLEALATAELTLGSVPAAVEALERAYRAHVAAGAPGAAALAACRLADVELTHTGAHAVASGWLELARRHQRDTDDPAIGVQVAMLGAYHALAYEKDVAAAVAEADLAVAHAELASDDASRLLAQATKGLATAMAGDVAAGFGLLDEAAASAVAGAVPSSVALDVYCILITACERVRAFDRIAQWSRRVLAVSGPDDTGFADFARTQYANVLIWTGRWSDAEHLLDVVLQDPESAPLSAAMGLVHRADLRRRQGRLDEAEEALATAEREPFRRAVRHMVLAARAEHELAAGRPQAAADVAARFLRIVPSDNRVERIPALVTTVRAALLLGQEELASRAHDELDATARALGTDAVVGAAAVARGLLASHRGEPDLAVAALEQAVDRLDAAGLPHDVAEARLHLVRCLLATGDTELARRELAAAATAAQRLGAAGLASQAAALGATVRAGSGDGGLTPREVEVLRLLTAGESNAAIADRLVLSARTVERHVSNIYLKLGITGSAARTVAAAYAREHGLV